MLTGAVGGVSFEWERGSGWEEGPHFALFGSAIREVALHRYIVHRTFVS